MPISTGSVKRVFLVVVVLLWASAFVLATEHAAGGAIRHNGKTMNLRAGVAVWNAAENQLPIALLPFEPTAAEVREIRNWNFRVDAKLARDDRRARRSQRRNSRPRFC